MRRRAGGGNVLARARVALERARGVRARGRDARRRRDDSRQRYFRQRIRVEGGVERARRRARTRARARDESRRRLRRRRTRGKESKRARTGTATRREAVARRGVGVDVAIERSRRGRAIDGEERGVTGERARMRGARRDLGDETRGRRDDGVRLRSHARRTLDGLVVEDESRRASERGKGVRDGHADGDRQRHELEGHRNRRASRERRRGVRVLRLPGVSRRRRLSRRHRPTHALRAHVSHQLHRPVAPTTQNLPEMPRARALTPSARRSPPSPTRRRRE